jgi:hypothetical protein
VLDDDEEEEEEEAEAEAEEDDDDDEEEEEMVGGDEGVLGGAAKRGELVGDPTSTCIESVAVANREMLATGCFRIL